MVYNISVLDKVKKPGIVAIDCPEGRFQHELDYQECSSPRSDKSLVLDLAPPLYCPSSKSKVYDRSPYRNIGTITGAIYERLWTGLWVLRLDGSDDYIDCGNKSVYNLSSSGATFEWWFKCDATLGDNYARILSRGEIDVAGYYAWIYSATGRLLLRWDGTERANFYPTKDYRDGSGHYIVWMVDASTDISNLYSDGDFVASGGFSVLIDKDTNLYLGGIGTNYSYKGLLLEAKVHDRALTPLESQLRNLAVKARYN